MTRWQVIIQWFKRLLGYLVVEYPESTLEKHGRGLTREEKIESCLNDYHVSLKAQLVIIVIWIVAMVIFVATLNNAAFMALDGLDIIFSSALICFLYQLYWQYRRYCELSRLGQTSTALVSRKFDNPQNRKLKVMDMSVGVLSIGIALVCFVSPIAMLLQQVDKALPVDRARVPSISLQALENEPNYRQKISSGYINNRDPFNRISFKSSLSVPKQFEIDESGEVLGSLWPDQSGVYSPSMVTDYYEARLNWVAKVLLDDLINNKMSRYEKTPQPMYLKGFDEVYIIEEGIKKEIAFRQGNIVCLVRYYGTKSMAELVDAVSVQYGEGLAWRKVIKKS